jgi:hypothetical protein
MRHALMVGEVPQRGGGDTEVCGVRARAMPSR